MYTKLKPGGGGKPQPYLAEGNGEKSGEYTDKYSSNINNYKRSNNQNNESLAFCKKQLATKENLRQLLTPLEYANIVKYTSYNYGRTLNKAIRDGILTAKQKEATTSIINAINKHYISSETTVFRGINVDENTFRNFLYSKEYGLVITGSLICSTSRDINRAFKGALNGSNNNFPIVFECIIPKNYNGLPVEDISLDRTEKEILLSAPNYYINSIDRKLKDNKYYYHINITLVR